MSDPRPPATPPPLPADPTREWAAGTPPGPNDATVTSSGSPPVGGDGFGIPNPFGRYTVARPLGRGGMGAVFLAHDSRLDRPVALKIPTFGGGLTDTQKERFLREARAISALRHPNICPVYEVGEEQGVLYLTMAYIEGQPLSALVERGPLPPDRAVELVRRVARAMQAAHAHGTVHRDLKPANILIDPAGEPVVTDFGLARRAQWADDARDGGPAAGPAAPGLTQYGAVLGTPAYMPPEQARGDQAAVGPRSDVYALGVILYELLSGRRPFAAPSTSDLIRQIETEPPPRLSEYHPWMDPHLEAVCLRALAKDPADRFASMAEFDRALKEAVDPELKAVVPPPLPPREPGRPARAKRRRHPLATVGCVLLALTGVLAVCVGGPTAAVYWLIGVGVDKVKEIQSGQERATAEWDAIMAFWQPPAADAPADLLFPPTLPDGYRRTRTDREVADAELGITLPGQRGVYTKDGDEYEVRAYRCTDEEAKALLANVYQYAQAVQTGTGVARPKTKRKKALYTMNNTGTRTVSFAFADDQNQTQEYGKLWYGGGWLYWFRTPGPLGMEFFPSKYLLEVGKRAAAGPAGKALPPPPPPPVGPVLEKGKAGPGPLGNLGGQFGKPGG